MAIIQVPVTKGKATLEVDTDKLPEHVWAEVILQGLKTIMNRGASKITKETYPDEAELKAAAMAKAEEQHKMALEGKTKLSGQKVAKASGKVMTEARRIAKAIVKSAMKEQGIKISHVDAKDITAAANMLLKDPEQGPPIIAEATATVEAEEAKASKGIGLDLKALIKPNPRKVAAAEAKKAKDKEQLSAKQAGKVAPRSKGKAQPQAQA